MSTSIKKFKNTDVTLDITTIQCYVFGVINEITTPESDLNESSRRLQERIGVVRM